MVAITPWFVYGTAWKEERTAALALRALENGFRAIDTANQRRHYHEAGVGEALQEAYARRLVRREELFLQTKFTYRGGQDHRLPYDPYAPVNRQVAQSMASSLAHLGTDYVDSYVLHGPASMHGWTESDADAWEAMRRERDDGRARMLGVSNVTLRHLQQMELSRTELPAFVQNRCFARLGWDREVRRFCRDRNIRYQGFSLLTANVEVLHQRMLSEIAVRLEATLAQVIFAFARQVGMLPLTGTSSVEHMREDLRSLEMELTPVEIEAIEQLASAPR